MAKSYRQMQREKIKVGDTVRHIASKELGVVRRKHEWTLWVDWEDGEYSTVLLSQVRPVLAGPKGRLPNPKPVKIYGRCLRIEAVKMRTHTYGGKPSAASQKYFHDFTTKNAIIYGLPDGSLLIKAK